MKRFVFGFDGTHPEACARALKARGVDGVVTGDVDARGAEALAAESLELHLCFGALSLGGMEAPDEHLAEDAAGAARRWFGSGCPNDEAVRSARLEAALEKLRRTPTVRGLFVDGARFASFASTEGPEAFHTCFCPRCRAKMEAMGLDAEALRAAVARLSSSRRVLPGETPRLQDWFAFRAACVRDYMERFAAAVHALPGRPLAEGFVFAPSLGGFVGQTFDAWRALDAVSPMLYRAYPHAEGPACLGHEWAAALRLYGRTALEALYGVAAEVSGISGLFPEADADTLAERGFPPERVGRELDALRGKMGPEQRLIPILQIEDRELLITERVARAHSAAGVGFFNLGPVAADEIPREA